MRCASSALAASETKRCSAASCAQQLAPTLVQVSAVDSQLGHLAFEALDEAAPVLDRGDRLVDPLRLPLHRLDGRRRLAQVGHLAAQLGHELLDPGEPRAGLGLAVAHPGDLRLGKLHLLQRVGHRGTRHAELAQVTHRGLDCRPCFLNASDVGGGLAHRACHLVQHAADAVQLGRLGIHARGLLGERLELPGEALGAGDELGHGVARFAQAVEAPFELGERAAQVGHPLGDRFQASALEVESLDGLLHLVLDRGEILADRTRAVVGLALHLVDLARAFQHRLVEALEARDLLFDGRQRALVVLLLARADVDLLHGAIQALRPRQRGLDRLALRLERRALAVHEVGQRLDGGHFALDVVDGVLDAVQTPHRALDDRHPALLVLQVAAQLLAPPVQGFHLGHRQLVRVQQPLMLLAQARHLIARSIDLATQCLGVAAQELERLLDIEKRHQALLELAGDVHLLAQVLEHLADPVRILDRSRDLALGALLTLDKARGARFDLLDLRGHLADRVQPLLHFLNAVEDAVEIRRRLFDRLAQLQQPCGRQVDALHHALLAHTFLLHRGQDLSHLLGGVTVLGAVPELEQRAHRCAPSATCRPYAPGRHRADERLR